MPKKAEPPPSTVDDPIFVVALDAEAYKWLHDMFVSKLRYTYAPKYLEMVKRTLLAFEEAAKANEPSPNGDEPPRKRTIPRTKARKR